MLRIDAGDFVVRPGRYRLATVVDEALKRFEYHLDGHHVVNHVPGDLEIDADRDLLSLALRQLLDNALKYSPETSTIEVLAHGDVDIALVVRNSGSTISERDQARLFERFYRGASAGHIAGTGMGLTIVQQIARAHNGAVQVTSTSKDGTAFTLSLPRKGPSV